MPNEPIDKFIDDMLTRVRLGIEELGDASVRGAEQRTADTEAIERVLSRADVQRAAAQSPEVAEAIENIHTHVKEAEVEGGQTASRLAEAQKRWNVELDVLAALLRG